MLRICLSVSVVASSLLAPRAAIAEDRPPRVMRAEEGFETPEGYRETTRSFRPLWLAGTIGSGASWAASLLASGLSYGLSGMFGSRKDDDYLNGIIPLVGPFFVVAETDTNDALFGSLGGLQIVSLGLLIAGLSTTQTVWVLDEDAPASATVGLSGNGVRVDF